MKWIPQALVPLALAMLACPESLPDAVGVLLIGLLALGLSTPDAMDQA